MTDEKVPSKGSNQAAGFSLPFGWGKKKDKKEDQAAAAPSPAATSTPTVTEQKTEAPPPPPQPTIAVRTYRVRAGDTLWDIAARYYGDGRQYLKIAAANNIVDPNQIDVGWELKIPD